MQPCKANAPSIAQQTRVVAFAVYLMLVPANSLPRTSIKGVSKSDFTIALNQKQENMQIALPDECDHCSHGLNDPFASTEKYCAKFSGECSCCQSTLQVRLSNICDGFKGYASCEDGIRAAMTKRQQACKQQQNASAAASAQQAAAAGLKLLGGRSNSSDSSSMLPLGVFGAKCAAHAAPTCMNHQELCDPGSGCSRKLWYLKNDYGNIKMLYELYMVEPCFH